MTFVPTEATVRDKLTQSGKLFASDEVGVLVLIIDSLRAERQIAIAERQLAVDAMREIQRKYLRTDRA